MFRITQEFINNTLKHASATRIDIRISREKEFFVMILKDNGVGFNLDEKKSAGMGLKNIRSRVKSYNGKVKIISGPGTGVELNIRIPLI